MPGEKITPRLDDLHVGALVNTDDGASSGARDSARDDARDSTRYGALINTRHDARDSTRYGALINTRERDRDRERNRERDRERDRDRDRERYRDRVRDDVRVSASYGAPVIPRDSYCVYSVPSDSDSTRYHARGSTYNGRVYDRDSTHYGARDDVRVSASYGAPVIPRDSYCVYSVPSDSDSTRYHARGSTYNGRVYDRDSTHYGARDDVRVSASYGAPVIPRDSDCNGGYRSSISSASQSVRDDYSSTYYARVHDRDNYHSAYYTLGSNRYYYNEHDTDPYGGLSLFPTSQE